MLKPGDKAPDFSAQTTDGRTLRLLDLRGKTVIIYFFPKAFTKGCTIETKQFRDAYPALQKLGAEVIGISTDEHQRQCDFAVTHGASFPMIGDENAEICKKFGVLWPILGISRRVTFVIDKQGIIQGVFSHEISVGKHVEDVRALLEKIA